MASQEYVDQIINIFLQYFKDGDAIMDEQRHDTNLLNSMVKRFVQLERWDDADYIRGMLGQDPCGAPGEPGVAGENPLMKAYLKQNPEEEFTTKKPFAMDIVFGKPINHHPGQEIGRPDRDIIVTRGDTVYSAETDFYGYAMRPPDENMFTLDGDIDEDLIKQIDEDIIKLDTKLIPLNLIDDTQDKRRDLDGPGIHGESVCDGST